MGLLMLRGYARLYLTPGRSLNLLSNIPNLHFWPLFDHLGTLAKIQGPENVGDEVQLTLFDFVLYV